MSREIIRDRENVVDMILAQADELTRIMDMRATRWGDFRDLEIVIQQTYCSPDTARTKLEKYNGDVIDAVIEIDMEQQRHRNN